MHGQEVFANRQCGVKGVSVWVVNLFLVWVFVGGRIGLICLPFFAGEGVPGVQVVWSTPSSSGWATPFCFLHGMVHASSSVRAPRFVFTWVGPCPLCLSSVRVTERG